MNLSLEMRIFLTHTSEVEWSLGDPLIVTPMTIREAEKKGWVQVEKWKGHYSSAKLTARGKSIVNWFLRYRAPFSAASRL